VLQVDAPGLLGDTESVALFYPVLGNCHYSNQLRCDGVLVLDICIINIPDFNCLKPSDKSLNLLVTRCNNRFNIQQLYVLPALYLCVL
jgi:hypothetical protein